jgi:glyoxylase-like metal-dependent hydrolase (beta-lactamase superfamily II)
MSYDLVRGATKAPVYVHEAEIQIPEDRIDARVTDGQEIRVGSARLQVIHTPGHTPGSICLKLGKVLLTGDALFPGGPGRTASPEDLSTALRSIGERLLALEDEVLVWPGHGDPGTLAEVRTGYRTFTLRPHRPDLAGCRGRSFRRLRLVGLGRLLELPHALAERAADVTELAGAEDQYQHKHDQD